MTKFACLDCGVPNNSSRCPECQQRRVLSAPPRQRASASSRGYDHEWKLLRIKILQRDGYVCRYCQKIMTKAEATVDHVVPLSKGGDRVAPTNLVACCLSCNSRKKDK